MNALLHAIVLLRKLVALLDRWFAKRQKSRNAEAVQKSRKLDQLRRALDARRNAAVDADGLPNDQYRRDR